MTTQALLKPFASIGPSEQSQGGFFKYIEGREPDPVGKVTSRKLTCQPLDKTEVGDWAWQRGKFEPSRPSDAQGSFRLLFAQSQSSHRVPAPEVLVSARVLDALQLPAWTFTSCSVASGVFSAHTVPDGSTIEECSKLSIIFRPSRSRNFANGGLALTYDFTTGATTALIATYSFEYNGLESTIESTLLTEFSQIVQGCVSCWGHPLLLPAVYLILHARNVRAYMVDHINEEVRLLESRIGIIKSVHGHSAGESERLFANGQMQRPKAAKFIQMLNELSKSIMHTTRSPTWDLAAIEWMSSLLEKHDRLQNFPEVSHNSFQEVFDYLRGYCEATLEVTQSTQERTKLQLSILYTLIAQDDGQTSARIAASAGKDSTSMKIIALITAAYLPATFVATLFSTGMFDWHVEDGSVSRSFWTYWAVAIPLTILTIAGWASWWTREKRQFETNVQRVVQGNENRKGRSFGKMSNGGLEMFAGLDGLQCQTIIEKNKP